MLDNDALFPGAPSQDEIKAAMESLQSIVYAVALLDIDAGRADLLHGLNPFTADNTPIIGNIDDIIRQYADRFVPAVAREALYDRINTQALKRAIDAGQRHMEVVFPRVFGRGSSFVHASITLSYAGNARRAVAMFQNVGELLTLRSRADSDMLTGLLNRQAAEIRIQEALDSLKEGDSGTFIFVDVDDLKRINDSHGHPSGDEALRRIAKAMRSTFRRETDHICRISGDEFVIWMHGVANAGLVERKIVEMHGQLGARRQGESMPALSFSVGAAFAKPGDTFAHLYAITDEALYRAKFKGKGICVFVDRDIPVQDTAQADAQAFAEGQRLMLVVDDTAINRFMLRQVFQDDYGIIEAEDGAQALAAIEKYGARIDAVMLDMVMPGMNGEQFLRAVKYTQYADAMPIIVLSADTNQDRIDVALSLGAADFIRKPFVPTLLRQRVQNITALYHKTRG